MKTPLIAGNSFIIKGQSAAKILFISSILLLIIKGWMITISARKKELLKVLKIKLLSYFKFIKNIVNKIRFKDYRNHINFKLMEESRVQPKLLRSL